MNFKQCVEMVFGFLAADRSFKVSAPSESFPFVESVAYRRGMIEIEIFRIKPPHPQEIGIAFRVQNDPRRGDFNTYLRFAGSAFFDRIGESVASSEADLMELLHIYSEALRLDGSKIVDGDLAEIDRFRRALDDGFGRSRIPRPRAFPLDRCDPLQPGRGLDS